MNKNQTILVAVAGFLFLAFLVVGIGGNIFVDSVADRVIEKLQKPWGPSPYGPGFDPDRINVNAFNRQPQQFQQPQPQYNPQWTNINP